MVGVTLFFSLSGFLITALLLAEGQGGHVSLRRFYERRARRLLPALMPVLLVAAVLEVHFGWDPIGELLVVLTYTSNWASALGAPMTLLSHTWSLAVEEQFYLLWPAVVVWSLRRKVPPLRLARWCIGGAVVSLGLRFLLPAVGMTHQFVWGSTVTRADALLVGCALAAALHGGWIPTRRASVTAAGLFAVALVIMIAARVRVDMSAPTLTMLAAVPVLLFALRSPAVLTASAIRWLGRRSYALYLWHYVLVAPSVWGLWALSPWQAVVLSFVVTEASWWLVERPFLAGVTRPYTGIVGVQRSRFRNEASA